uniref:Fibronectin type-III domain-containing protein n=1 Tax=Palpitomonas bilix TaxID=652834 RepID=A0A7S3D2R2_9EUKA
MSGTTTETGATLDGSITAVGGILVGLHGTSGGSTLVKSATDAHRIYSGKEATPEFMDEFKGSHQHVLELSSVDLSEESARWRHSSRLPAPLSKVSVIPIPGERWSVFGVDAQAVQSRISTTTLNTRAGRWSSVRQLKSSEGASVSHVQGSAVVIGGRDAKEEREIELVRLDNTAMASVAVRIAEGGERRLPGQLRGHCSVGVGHQVVNIGGYCLKEGVPRRRAKGKDISENMKDWLSMEEVYILDTQTHVWRKADATSTDNFDIPASREQFSCATVGSGVFCFGGRGPSVVSEPYYPPGSLDATLDNLTHSRVKAAEAVRLLNGAPKSKKETEVLDDLFYLDTSKRPMRWEAVVTAGQGPGKRYGHSMMAVRKATRGDTASCSFVSRHHLADWCLVVYGGWMPVSKDVGKSLTKVEQSEALFDGVYILDLNHLVWSCVRFPGPSMSRYGHALVYDTVGASRVSAGACTCEGRGLAVAYKGRFSSFTLRLFSSMGDAVVGSASVVLSVFEHSVNDDEEVERYNGVTARIRHGSKLETSIIDRLDGTFSLFYIVPEESGCSAVDISLQVDGEEVEGFPKTVSVIDAGEESEAANAEEDALTRAISDPVRRKLVKRAAMAVAASQVRPRSEMGSRSTLAIAKRPQRAVSAGVLKKGERGSTAGQMQKPAHSSAREGEASADAGLAEFNLAVSPAGRILPPRQRASRDQARAGRARSAPSDDRQWQRGIDKLDAVLNVWGAPSYGEEGSEDRETALFSAEHWKDKAAQHRRRMKESGNGGAKKGKEERASVLASIYGARPGAAPPLEVGDVGDTWVQLKWSDLGGPHLGKTAISAYAILEKCGDVALVERSQCAKLANAQRPPKDTLRAPRQPPPPQLSITLSSLQPGVEYSFRMAFLNGEGRGGFSHSTCVVRTKAGKPGKCAVPPVAVGVTSNSATLLWVAPQSDGGAPIEHYEIVTTFDDAFKVREGDARSAGMQLQGAGKEEALLRGQAMGLSQEALQLIEQNEVDLLRLAEVFGLDHDMNYNFVVAAANKMGTGEASDPSDDVHTVDTVPPPMEPAAVFSHREGGYSILWHLPLSNPSSVENVKVKVEGEHGDDWIIVYTKTVPSKEGECVWEPSESDSYSSYRVSLQSINSVGEGPLSTPTFVSV